MSIGSGKKVEDAQVSREALILEYAFVYGVNLDKREILITEEIDESTFIAVDAAITQLEMKNGRAITLKLNSPGGDLYSAVAIIGRIRESKCAINTKGYGCVASGAAMILASGTGVRSISKYATFMHHEPSYGLDAAKHTEIKVAVSQADRESKLWANMIAEFSNGDVSFWTKRQKRDFYITPDELVNLHVVDKVF